MQVRPLVGGWASHNRTQIVTGLRRRLPLRPEFLGETGMRAAQETQRWHRSICQRPAFDLVVSDVVGEQAQRHVCPESVGTDALHSAAYIFALMWMWGLGQGVRTNVISVSGWAHGKEKVKCKNNYNTVWFSVRTNVSVYWSVGWLR